MAVYPRTGSSVLTTLVLLEPETGALARNDLTNSANITANTTSVLATKLKKLFGGGCASSVVSIGAASYPKRR